MALELPRIKVCGLRGLEDLPRPLPEELDAIGFVAWHRSPRVIDPAIAARIVASVPDRVLPIAVMVAPLPDDAQAWMRASGCRVLQLCGDDTPESWIGFPHPILRRVAVDEDALEEIEAWSGIAAGFVLDHPSAPGGTGRTVDEELARDIADRVPCLLAGGLAADNVAGLVEAVRPRGVDASSRLENERRRKDPLLVGEFVAAADRALRRVNEARA